SRPERRAGRYRLPPIRPNRRGGLYLDLELRAAARDRFRGRLHDRHRPSRLLRRHREWLSPGEMVREVAVKTILVAPRKTQHLFVAPSPAARNTLIRAGKSAGTGSAAQSPMTAP